MSRKATVRTAVEHPALVAAALRPDNTPQMTTVVEGDGESGDVVTTIERETTGGLQTTVDDYLVNLTVATEVVQHTDTHTRPTDNE